MSRMLIHSFWNRTKHIKMLVLDSLLAPFLCSIEKLLDSSKQPDNVVQVQACKSVSRGPGRLAICVTVTSRYETEHVSARCSGCEVVVCKSRFKN